MSFDLPAYAKAHRYRIRNLHDGHPRPPARPPYHSRRGRFSGYGGADDRMDTIICRHGYVCDDGDGRIGWFLSAPTMRGTRAKLRKLAALGVNVLQEGDTETAGDAPAEQVAEVLGVLTPCRVRKHPGYLPIPARQSDAAGAAKAEVRPRGPNRPQSGPSDGVSASVRAFWRVACAGAGGAPCSSGSNARRGQV